MMNLHRRCLLALLLAAGVAATASAQSSTVRLRGTVVSRDGDALTVAPRTGGPVKLALTAGTIVTAVIPARLADIKPGSFIGTAAMPGPNDSVIAIEVHVFPESMRGLGEGHRPFDLRPDSTMTNGTVGNVVGSNGRTLTVSYKGGETTVIVPADAPIVAFEPGSREQLVPGAHVIVFARKAANGTLNPTRILVGKDGLVPPM